MHLRHQISSADLSLYLLIYSRITFNFFNINQYVEFLDFLRGIFLTMLQMVSCVSESFMQDHVLSLLLLVFCQITFPMFAGGIGYKTSLLFKHIVQSMLFHFDFSFQQLTAENVK